MPEIWGTLAKSQVDPQTIDEAIAAAIAAHESDPSAHLGTGESLESHKTSEIIDHLAGSIVGDKLQQNFFNHGKIPFIWPSLDGFQVSAPTSTLRIGEYYLQSATSNGSIAYALAKDGQYFRSDFSKSPVLEFSAYLSLDTNCECFIGMGDMTGYDDRYQVGFRYQSGQLYAMTYDDATVSSTLTAITGSYLLGYHDFAIEYEHGVEARFFIDQVLVATISTTLPDTGAGPLFEVYLKKVSSGLTPAAFIGPLAFTLDQTF